MIVVWGFESMQPYWHWNVNAHTVPNKFNRLYSTLRGINSKISIAVGKNSRLSGGLYYRDIDIAHGTIIMEHRKLIEKIRDVIKPKFGCRIDYDYLYNDKQRFIGSYTYDNWMQSQINLSWIIEISLHKNLGRVKKLRDCLRRLIETSFGLSLEQRPISKEVISEAGLKAAQRDFKKAIETFEAKKRKLISATENSMLKKYGALTDIKEKIVKNATQLWLALNVVERRNLIHLTKGIGAERTLPLELQAIIGTDILANYMPPAIHHPNSITTVLLEYIHAIIEHDLNITQQTMSILENTYTQYHSPKLKAFWNFSSDQDNKAKIIMSEYYASK